MGAISLGFFDEEKGEFAEVIEEDYMDATKFEVSTYQQDMTILPTSGKEASTNSNNKTYVIQKNNINETMMPND